MDCSFPFLALLMLTRPARCRLSGGSNKTKTPIVFTVGGDPMPTILTLGPYRFHFHSNENREPPHIHLDFEGNDAKFWLEPVALAKNRGVPAHRLGEIL